MRAYVSNQLIPASTPSCLAMPPPHFSYSQVSCGLPPAQCSCYSYCWSQRLAHSPTQRKTFQHSTAKKREHHQWLLITAYQNLLDLRRFRASLGIRSEAGDSPSPSSKSSCICRTAAFKVQIMGFEGWPGSSRKCISRLCSSYFLCCLFASWRLSTWNWLSDLSSLSTSSGLSRKLRVAPSLCPGSLVTDP